MANYCQRCQIEIDESELHCYDCEGWVVDTWMCPDCDWQNDEDDSRCQGDDCNCSRPPRPWR